MSSLLERAIIDATQLKEAALKNAEKMVIEKYSNEVRTAVDNLLSGHFEQEGANVNEQEMPAAEPAAGDPFGFEGLPGEGAEPDAAAAEMGVDPGLEGEPAEEEEPLNPDDLISKVPDAFLAGDDEVIRIKLDSLSAEMDEEPDGPFASGEDEIGEDEIGIDIDDEEIELGSDFDIESPEPAGDVGVDISRDMVSEILKELEIDTEDEEVDLDELMERIRVDFEPQKSGWAGTPEAIMREYESMLLAREQDDEVKEENEELRKTVSKLQKENKTLTSAATKLQAQTENYETAFERLQEKLETMNVSNAKLLYINQALENASLNERQKKKLVEAISKAETVQEAKIVFDTMNDTVVTNLDAKKESTLNEVVSRRSSLLVAARKEQKTKSANPVYSRMQTLAGIKTE